MSFVYCTRASRTQTQARARRACPFFARSLCACPVFGPRGAPRERVLRRPIRPASPAILDRRMLSAILSIEALQGAQPVPRSTGLEIRGIRFEHRIDIGSSPGQRSLVLRARSSPSLTFYRRNPVAVRSVGLAIADRQLQISATLSNPQDGAVAVTIDLDAARLALALGQLPGGAGLAVNSPLRSSYQTGLGPLSFDGELQCTVRCDYLFRDLYAPWPWIPWGFRRWWNNADIVDMLRTSVLQRSQLRARVDLTIGTPRVSFLGFRFRPIGIERIHLTSDVSDATVRSRAEADFDLRPPAVSRAAVAPLNLAMMRAPRGPRAAFLAAELGYVYLRARGRFTVDTHLPAVPLRALLEDPMATIRSFDFSSLRYRFRQRPIRRRRGLERPGAV